MYVIGPSECHSLVRSSHYWRNSKKARPATRANAIGLTPRSSFLVPYWANGRVGQTWSPLCSLIVYRGVWMSLVLRPAVDDNNDSHLLRARFVPNTVRSPLQGWPVRFTNSLNFTDRKPRCRRSWETLPRSPREKAVAGPRVWPWICLTPEPSLFSLYFSAFLLAQNCTWQPAQHLKNISFRTHVPSSVSRSDITGN